MTSSIEQPDVIPRDVKKGGKMKRKTRQSPFTHLSVWRAATIACACLLFGSLSGCTKGTEEVREQDFAFDGTCINCHAGLSAAQVHANYKLRCVDCHGGNDQVDVPPNAFEDEDIFRDQELLVASHVKPKPGLARFFYGNGIDDDLDGEIDEGPEFDDDGLGNEILLDFGEIAEPGLQGEGVGQFVDSEYNRDLTFTRWLNPGDLRVAKMTCGSSSAANEGSGCHQPVVDSNRRSVMTNNSAVINGAYYGNESWRVAFQEARDAEGAAVNPRKGAFGYVLDYDGIDGCINELDPNRASGGREQPTFDSACLEALAADNDPNAVAGAPGNVASNVGEADLPAFEATQGNLARQDGVDGVEFDTTLAHKGVTKTRFPGWGGKPLKDPEASIAVMKPVLNEELILTPGTGLPDPVDLILRGFRAYFPLNYPGSVRNQNFVFGESIKPNVDIFKTSNPYGRGHSMGCTSCHMKYNFDGSRDPQKIAKLENGKTVFEEVIDPTTKHREFDQTKDIQEIDGEQRLVGMAVTTAEREFAGVADEDQQRMYSANHEITSQIETDTCGLCHAFVTRVNFAYTGMTEEEQRDALARRKAIEFVSAQGDQVRILDSWVREETIAGETTLIIPDGVEIIDLARKRDKELADLGLIPGFGGCVPSVFTEDCNNNGRLDTELTLQKIDENGEVLAETIISEDLNNNGKLDLIDRVPRENSYDGRQVRYVYGGVNAATRLMDIHFERGMHCIDCHQLQDNHGDGHLYGTNHEVIEIECDDCHGSLTEKATLITSGANGGNLMTAAVDRDGKPFFEVKGDKIIQRSRVTPGLTWVVPQLPDTFDPDNAEFNARTEIAHSPFHLTDVATENGFTKGSEYEGVPGESEMKLGKLECYSCHTSWVLNCMGCHDNTNLGDFVKKSLLPDGTIEKVAGENEVWFNNSNQAGATNFQLLAFLRSPFVLGATASADSQRIAPFRSSMIVHASINDPDGTLVDNINFTTFQKIDGNSGRGNVATSGAAMNQTMPHTVRPEIVRSCESCHALVDKEGRVRNDHILGETMGLGASRYGYVGDWVMTAGQNGVEFFEYKQENQFPGSQGSSRFPGVIVNPLDRVDAAVEPILDGTGGIDNTFLGTDIVLIRNFNPTPAAAGQTQPPTLRDIVVTSHSNGATGAVLITDVSGRGHPMAVRPSVGNDGKVLIIPLDDVANALAHLAPDVSDPFVYVANGPAGLTVIEIKDAPTAGANTATVLTTVAIPGGASATEIVLAGDVAYVGTDAGTIETFDLSVPEAPTHVNSFEIDPAATVNGLAVGAFILYIGTDQGLAVLSIIEDPLKPEIASGVDEAIVLAGQNINELTLASGHLYLAVGTDGVLDVDVTTAANPVILQNLVDVLAPDEAVDVQDVLVSILPGQQWILAADASGDMLGFKLDNTIPVKERCMPDPQAANCGLDMDFRDPTVTGRDPAFDPVAGVFDAADPSGEPFFRQAGAILASARRMARPGYYEKINTQTGRRVRDSFMPGAGTLSYPVMKRMYKIQVCENEDTVDLNGNGLGQLGFVDDNFLASGNCTELGKESSARKIPVDEFCGVMKIFNAATGHCDSITVLEAEAAAKR